MRILLVAMMFFFAGCGGIQTRPIENPESFVAEKPEYEWGDEYEYRWGLKKTTNTVSGLAWPNVSKLIDFPISVGKTWQTSEKSKNTRGVEVEFRVRFSVVDYETVILPSGEFDSFKIRCDNIGGQYAVGWTLYLWYCPSIKNFVKTQTVGHHTDTPTFELVSYKLAK